MSEKLFCKYPKCLNINIWTGKTTHAGISNWVQMQHFFPSENRLVAGCSDLCEWSQFALRIQPSFLISDNVNQEHQNENGHRYATKC